MVPLRSLRFGRGGWRGRAGAAAAARFSCTRCPGAGGWWLLRGRALLAGGSFQVRPLSLPAGMAARFEYIPPWWTYWLHNFPHVNLRFQPVDNTFSPQDANYQQALIFLAIVAAVCLGLNLIFVLIYLLCICCCKPADDEENKKLHSCCVTWTAVAAGLICCAAIGIGFYGNSETNDGVYQLTTSIYNANHTLAGIDGLVSETVKNMGVDMKQHIARLDEIFTQKMEFIYSLKMLQHLADVIISQLSGLPTWNDVNLNVAETANEIGYIEYYRWLSYLLLLIVYLVICLAAFLGLAKRSRWLLTLMIVLGVLTVIVSWGSLGLDTAAAVGTSDFCVAPDKFIMNMTQNKISSDIVHYYLYCGHSTHNPFQQTLLSFQRALTNMQLQIQGLMHIAIPLFPMAKKDIIGIQQLLNKSESNLHQLTAMLDCRGLHKDYLDAVNGVCYDGVEGLLYLLLFSLLAAAGFSALICAISRNCNHIAIRDRNYDDMDEDDPFNPQARRIAAHNPSRSQIHSFCSFNSSMGSQTSLQPPVTTATTQPATAAPAPVYMNNTVLFGGNPRFENVPLIGRNSPPPSYTPSMRATYLAVSEEPSRIYGNVFPA
ncbi:protein tweety homolog 2 isoform X1 [Hypanus sabinus]|uniref:protein tweety homolog 2 isoform X1 n=2 Tax=Hypanus sabinus TaxID=79690 RepID=UPI0028C4CC48|nr:protein tweety homolog 2 isoform X1 [Hypanus sabinus]